jgi:peroxiredoxin
MMLELAATKQSICQRIVGVTQFVNNSFDPINRGETMLKVGESAPEFTGITHEGQPLSLSSLRGRKVLLWFYPKADTGG